MRTDHHAYQRAARVSAFGLLLQAGIGLTLLILGRLLGDTTLQFASYYVLVGGLIWISLIVLFQQHKLEQLEALEHDEFDEEGFSAGSAFASEADEDIRVARKRLRRLHQIGMPIASLVIATVLGLLAWRLFAWLGRERMSDLAEVISFDTTANRGWALAICLAFAAISFIFSRFVAGMAKQAAWSNLRGGAAYMVGNALVLLAVAIGIIFRFFDNDQVIYGVAYAVPAFMVFVGAEIVLNFLLNLYRPRIPGEFPRPAFDSKVLSLLSAPDSLVRSINEAVNYQFGFDVTSSWGYQLLLRSFGKLIAFSVIVIVLMNMVVIVEPEQKAVKLAGGRIVNETVYDSGLVWKLPWPLQTVEIVNVSEVRKLKLTATAFGRNQIDLWQSQMESDLEFEPFLVTWDPRSAAESAAGQADFVSDQYALVDAEISVQYRVKDGDGLLNYLQFSSDERARRARISEREQALKALALREITQKMAQLELDDAIGDRRAEVARVLRDQVQASFDANGTGVEVVAVTVTMLRPAGESIAAWVSLPVDKEARKEILAVQQGQLLQGLASAVGDPEKADVISAAIDAYDALIEAGADDEALAEQRLEIEALITAAGGEVAQAINIAERDRWVTQLGALARRNEVLGERAIFEAAPEIYKERLTMAVLGRTLERVNKYILSIDPERVRFETDLKPVDSLLSVDQALRGEGEK